MLFRSGPKTRKVRKDTGCKKCFKKRFPSNKQSKYTLGTLSEFAKAKNVEIVSFTDIKSPITINCKKHGISDIKAYSLYGKTPNPCPKCGLDNRIQSRKMPPKKLRELFSNIGFVIKESDEYLNNNDSKSALTLECLSCSAQVKKKRTDLYRKTVCRTCFPAGFDRRKTIEEADAVLKNTQYTLATSVYLGSSVKTDLQCKKRGIFKARISDIKQGHGCPSCGQTISVAEKALFDILKPHFPDIVSRDTELIKPLELDIFLPSIKTAIEYDGLRWHSEQFSKTNKSLIKHNMLKKKGITLITIRENEWRDGKDRVLNSLKSKLGLYSDRIFARKCSIKIIDKKIAKSFLDKNHIQGSVRALLSWGLFYGDELVGVSTVSSHHRGSKSSVVLSRVCFGSVLVVGGFSKMLSSIKKWMKDNNISSIISWSDNRWSSGNVYLKNGFSLDANLRSDYFYVKQKEVKSKQSMSKKHLTKLGAVGLTEKEMAKSLGYYRVWDCGKKRWVLKI